MKQSKVLSDFSWKGFKEAFVKNGYGSITISGMEPVLYFPYIVKGCVLSEGTIVLSISNPIPGFLGECTPSVTIEVYPNLVTLNETLFLMEVVGYTFVVEKIDDSVSGDPRYRLESTYLVRIGTIELRFE